MMINSTNFKFSTCNTSALLSTGLKSAICNYQMFPLINLYQKEVLMKIRFIKKERGAKLWLKQ